MEGQWRTRRPHWGGEIACEWPVEMARGGHFFKRPRSETERRKWPNTERGGEDFLERREIEEEERERDGERE